MHRYPNYTVLKTYLQTKNANNVKAANSWNPWWLAGADDPDRAVMGQGGRTLMGAGIGGLIGAGLGGLGGVIKDTFITPEHETNYLRRVLRWASLGGLGGAGLGALAGSTRYAREFQEHLQDEIPFLLESTKEKLTNKLPDSLVIDVPLLGDMKVRMFNTDYSPRKADPKQSIQDRSEFDEKINAIS